MPNQTCQVFILCSHPLQALTPQTLDISFNIYIYIYIYIYITHTDLDPPSQSPGSTPGNIPHGISGMFILN